MQTKVELLVTALLSLNAAMDLRAQGYVRFDNLTATNWLVYLSIEPPTRLLDRDVSFRLIGGHDTSSMHPLHTWLLSDGSALGINVAPGRFADPSGGVYAVPGVQPGEFALLVVEAWVGNYTSAQEAGAAGGAVMFPNPTGTAVSAPGLTGIAGMDSLIIGIPEPNSLTVLALGAAGLLWRRRGAGHT